MVLASPDDLIAEDKAVSENKGGQRAKTEVASQQPAWHSDGWSNGNHNHRGIEDFV